MILKGKVEFLMNRMREKKCCICFSLFIYVPVLLSINLSCVFSQPAGERQEFYFISDVQSPMFVEKLFLKAYRNEEARDSLVADIKRHKPEYVFMLGDLTSRGSDENAWAPLDRFLFSMREIKTRVYAIPGNHEYLTNTLNGVRLFKHHFQEEWMEGYSVRVDSLAIVMLNSNFEKQDEKTLIKQQAWYKAAMDSLDSDRSVKAIIVCTHHPPYSNSMIVGSSEEVQDLIVPTFEKSEKSKLFISGHSHNLEYFSGKSGKHFLIIGGGGGLTQPLLPPGKRNYDDLINPDTKPLYFYLVVERNGNLLTLTARGFKRDFRFFEMEIGTVMLD